MTQHLLLLDLLKPFNNIISSFQKHLLYTQMSQNQPKELKKLPLKHPYYLPNFDFLQNIL